jgi:hypothetical protein
MMISFSKNTNQVLKLSETNNLKNPSRRFTSFSETCNHENNKLFIKYVVAIKQLRRKTVNLILNGGSGKLSLRNKNAIQAEK